MLKHKNSILQLKLTKELSVKITKQKIIKFEKIKKIEKLTLTINKIYLHNLRFPKMSHF